MEMMEQHSPGGCFRRLEPIHVTALYTRAVMLQTEKRKDEKEEVKEEEKEEEEQGGTLRALKDGDVDGSMRLDERNGSSSSSVTDDNSEAKGGNTNGVKGSGNIDDTFHTSSNSASGQKLALAIRRLMDLLKTRFVQV